VAADFDARSRIFDHTNGPNPLREDGQALQFIRGLMRWRITGTIILRALDVPEADCNHHLRQL